MMIIIMNERTFLTAVSINQFRIPSGILPPFLRDRLAPKIVTNFFSEF